MFLDLYEDDGGDLSVQQEKILDSFKKLGSVIAFADGWVDTETVITECEARNLPLHIIENANHSLETGDWAQDIRNLENIMLSVEKYIAMEGEPTCFS